MAQRPQDCRRRSVYRGQGTFEYVLLLGGVLLIVVLAFVVLQSNFFQSSKNVSDVQLHQCQAAAQQATTCYVNSQFVGTKSFSMLGYQANPLFCNCSDYNPEAFTITQSPVRQVDFSSFTPTAQFSVWRFDSPPAQNFAICCPLSPGQYQFFRVTSDNQQVQIDPDAVTAVANGKSAYCFNENPSGSRIKINPLTKISQDDKLACIANKDASVSASDLETQAKTANTLVEKPLDSNIVLRLLPGSDSLRATFTFTPVEDSSDGFLAYIPVSFDKILKTFPTASEIKQDVENPDVSVASWDKLKLVKDKPFAVIIVFKPENKDAQSVSVEVDSKVSKVKGKSKRVPKAGSCVLQGGFSAPAGIVTGNCCPGLSAQLGFCQPKSTQTPSRPVNPSALVSDSSSVSPSSTVTDSPTPKSGCTAPGKSCLPLVLDKCCQTNDVCRNPDEGLDRFIKFQCLPASGKATPTPEAGVCVQVGKPCELKKPCCKGLGCFHTDSKDGPLTFECLPDTTKLQKATPTPTPNLSNCVQANQECQLSGTSCCNSLSCIPDKKTPGKLSCQTQSSNGEGTPTSSPEPADLSPIQSLDSTSWIFEKVVESTPAKTPEPEFKLMHEVDESKSEQRSLGKSCDRSGLVFSPCADRLVCSIEEHPVLQLKDKLTEQSSGGSESQGPPTGSGGSTGTQSLQAVVEESVNPLAGLYTCQEPSKKTSSDNFLGLQMEEVSKGSSESAGSSTATDSGTSLQGSSASLDSASAPANKPPLAVMNIDSEIDKLVSDAGGKGFVIPNYENSLGGEVKAQNFVRDKKGYLYLAFQQPAVAKHSSVFAGGGVLKTYQYESPTNVAVSKDNGKTWTYIPLAVLPADDQLSFTPAGYTSPPALPGHSECTKYEKVQKTATDTHYDRCPNLGICFDKDGPDCLKKYYSYGFGPGSDREEKRGIGANCGGGTIWSTYDDGLYAPWASQISAYQASLCPVEQDCLAKAKTDFEKGQCTAANHWFAITIPWDCGCNPPTTTRKYDDYVCSQTEHVVDLVTVCDRKKDPKTGQDTCTTVEACRNSPGNCVDTEEVTPTPRPFTPTPLYYTAAADLHQVEFEGLAPNPSGGVFFYYRKYSTQMTHGEAPVTDQTNQSELHVVVYDGKNSPTDRLLSSKSYPNWYGFLHFVGSNAGKQFFIEGDQLYVSDDGFTLKPHGSFGYNEPYWRVKTPAFRGCRDNGFVDQQEVDEWFDFITTGWSTTDFGQVSDSSAYGHVIFDYPDYFLVPGGRVFYISKYGLPVIQQSDGYFANPGYIQLKAMGNALDFDEAKKEETKGYLNDPIFNTEFYSHYFQKVSNAYWNGKYTYGSAMQDSQGNIHVALLGYLIGNGQIYSGNVYDQFFPASAFDRSLVPEYTHVYVLSQSKCPACDQVKKWLTDSKINFDESLDAAGSKIQLIVKDKLQNMKNSDYPLTVIQTRDGDNPEFEYIYQNDSIALSTDLGIVIQPLLVVPESGTKRTISTGTRFIDLGAKIFLSPKGTPTIWRQDEGNTKLLGQYDYASGSWTKTPVAYDFLRKSNLATPILATRPDIFGPSSGYASYFTGGMLRGFDMQAAQFPYIRYAFSTGSVFVAKDESSSLSIPPILLYDHNVPDGTMLTQGIVDIQGSQFTADVQYSKNYFNLLTTPYSPPKSNIDEPEAGQVLTELVPKQVLHRSFSVNFDAKPDLSVSSTPSGALSAVLEPKDGAWGAKISVDATSYLDGPVLKVPDNLVSGKVSASTDSSSSDMPIKLSVSHEQPELFAYAAPSVVKFYTVDKKTVDHWLYLVNNFAFPLTFSCGSEFTQMVAAHSVSKVELRPPSPNPTNCHLALNGVETKQKMVFVAKSLSSSEKSHSELQLPAPVAVTENNENGLANFRDCAEGYCNCRQAQEAMDSFKKLVSYHAWRINSVSEMDTVKGLYSDGFSEKMILRTGVFDDLDDKRLGACTVDFHGWSSPLQPGKVYQVTLFVPFNGWWLDARNTYPSDISELEQQWTLAFPNGPGVDQEHFVQLAEVR